MGSLTNQEESMNDVTAAIDRGIAEHNAKTARLRALRQVVEALDENECAIVLNGEELELPVLVFDEAQLEISERHLEPVPDPQPEPAPRRKARADRKPPGGASEKRATPKAGRSEAAVTAGQKAILDFVRTHPGAIGKEVAEGVGIDQSSASRRLTALARDGKFEIEKGARGAKHYRLRSAAMPTDDSGAKTGDERKMVEALREADGPAQTAELSGKCGVSVPDTARILSGLQRRGVVRRVPAKNDSEPARWELAKAA